MEISKKTLRIRELINEERNHIVEHLYDYPQWTKKRIEVWSQWYGKSLTSSVKASYNRMIRANRKYIRTINCVCTICNNYFGLDEEFVEFRLEEDEGGVSFSVHKECLIGLINGPDNR
jgi:hypothetical protein